MPPTISVKASAKTLKFVCADEETFYSWKSAIKLRIHTVRLDARSYLIMAEVSLLFVLRGDPKLSHCRACGPGGSIHSATLHSGKRRMMPAFHIELPLIVWEWSTETTDQRESRS